MDHPPESSRGRRFSSPAAAGGAEGPGETHSGSRVSHERVSGSEPSSPELAAPLDDESEQQRLISRFGRRFAAGESIFREGEAAGEAFLVQEGKVRLLKRVRMVERSLLLLKPGDLFGESALLDEGARSSSAVALTDTVLLVLGRTHFRALFEHYPAIASRVIEQLIRRVRDAEDQIEIMLLRDTQLKVVSALLKLAHRATGSAEIAMSPVELSSRVGVDVDTVKRTVQRLREQQYLRILGERIEIPDVESLRRLYVLLGTKDEIAGDAGAR